jgi:propionate catabolism operon transcriptional regulator
MRASASSCCGAKASTSSSGRAWWSSWRSRRGCTRCWRIRSTRIRKGFEDAIELARVARLEAGRYEQLNGVLHNLQEAVLAVDRDNRIIAVNPPMQQLLGHAPARCWAARSRLMQPELSLQPTLDHGLEERARVQRFAQRDWVVNRTPIREHGEIVGAALTLYDARAIQEADTSLRMQHGRRQSAARHTLRQSGRATARPSCVPCRRRSASRATTSRC